MQKTIVVDNYDSFTYNLVHYLEDISQEEVTVVRNDQLEITDLNEYDAIVLSPGPGLPKESGKLMELIDAFHRDKKILGVCLGHQAIAEYFGGILKNLEEVYHGLSRTTKVIENDPLFKELPTAFQGGRYHSWVVDNNQLPEELAIIAEDEERSIMALRHQTLNIRGVQFHPESVLTEHGKQLLKNWLEL